tara:strand:- start:213 stop:383 length:171 start_codon:yes stop_codon:yes gene_type:complete
MGSCFAFGVGLTHALLVSLGVTEIRFFDMSIILLEFLNNQLCMISCKAGYSGADGF